METISNLIDRIEGLWYGESKKEIEGHIMMSDNKNNKTLVMVKEGDKFWKTKWFNNSENYFKTPNEPLSKIFV